MSNSGKIIVTGALGVCGRWLIESGLNATYTDRKSINLYQEFPRDIDILEGELTDSYFVDRILKESDTLIHLAGNSKVDGDLEDIIENNIKAMAVLVNGAIENKVSKIIFASSNHVVGLIEEQFKPHIYYNPNMDIGIFTGRQFVPDSVYGASKLFGEGLLDLFCSELPGSCAISLRIGTIWPPQLDHDLAQADCYKKDCFKTDEGFSELKYEDLHQRQRLFRVPGGYWVKRINELIHDSWVGHRIEQLVAPNRKTWIEGISPH